MMRKAVFFTLLAIVLTGLFIGSFTFYIQYQESRQMDAVESRISALNDLVKTISTDLERALYISSFRALLSLESHISETGEYLNNTQSDFSRMLMEGTAGNNTYMEPLMVNQTIINWSDKIVSLASQMDAALSLELHNITISHTTPWEVEVSAMVNLSLVDTKGMASWHSINSITTSIDIQGLEDPVYLISTNGRISRPISRTNITSWDVTALSLHLESAEYASSSTAPSFLERMEGNFSASVYGIETLVDTNELDAYGEPINDASSVDYLYFMDASTNDYSIHNITDDGWPFFRLDSGHLSFYGAEGANYTS